MKHKHRFSLIGGLIAIAGIICIYLLIQPFLPFSYDIANDEVVAKHLKKLDTVMKTANVDAINDLIETATYQIELQERKESGLPIDNKFLFRRSALIGDSLSKGLVEYRLLDQANVFAERGKRISTSGELIDAAIAFHPQNVFMQFGMNDILVYRGDPEPFIRDYEAMVDKIHAALPDAQLFVISIHPISPTGLANYPNMQNYQAYNESMKKLCERKGMTYLDMSMLLNENSSYEFDGVHPKQPYYSDWVDLMIMMIERKGA